jgi:hypothetical protein
MLWAITCYFNPAGYKRRLQNYRAFRERITVPLVTVEQSFTGEFALGPGDADVLIQLAEGDILFQKERLLNIALESVPAQCDAVAWIDADVIFGSDTWAEDTLAALERHAVLQMFSERYDLLPESRPEEINSWNQPYDRRSLMAKFAAGEFTSADLRPKDPKLRNTAWGLAWAARKDVLDRHGFYDACVMASGDIAIFCAGIGALDAPILHERMNEPTYRHYLEWARPFHETVRGSVGHLDRRIFHLWHGHYADRKYSTCMTSLRDLGFNPYTDLAKTELGCWRWNSDKPELHAHVRDYFWSRKEDDDSNS